MPLAPPSSPAEEASARAQAEILRHIENGQSFLLEAGAGAGKTHILVQTLVCLVGKHGRRLRMHHQQIACITFTNVAKDEIEVRTDRSPLIATDTIHGFCWSLIRGFQKELRSRLPAIAPCAELIEGAGDLKDRAVQYTLGHRSIDDGIISIHHDDVLHLAIELMGNEKFRRMMSDKYPFILIDEYQDANRQWIDAVTSCLVGRANGPLFGFFGDRWQKIYGDGCGTIESPHLAEITLNANFRSVPTVVDCLNRLRPELPQSVADPTDVGELCLFHTNDWPGERRTQSHWKGDLQPEDCRAAVQAVIALLGQRGWDLSPEHTKLLMLTHTALADAQGYESLPNIFKYNDAFAKKEQVHLAFFVDVLEPAFRAFTEKCYGQMLAVLGGPQMAGGSADKRSWSEAMLKLSQLRDSGTVGDVIAHLRQSRKPQLPDSVELLEQELESFDTTGAEEMPRRLCELGALHRVLYREIVALTDYHSGHSPFETKHGVKGAEFENVLAIVGRGWNQYNFDKMLTMARDINGIPASRTEAFERNRNLFYVTCSRAKRRLALLFTQELSAPAMQTLEDWFGREAIEALPIPEPDNSHSSAEGA